MYARLTAPLPWEGEEEMGGVSADAAAALDPETPVYWHQRLKQARADGATDVSVYEDTLAEMKAAVGAVTPVAWTLAMSGAARQITESSTQGLAVVERIFEGMSETQVPGVEQYSVLVDAYARAHQMPKALSVVRTMGEAGVLGNCVVFTHLINGFLRTGNTQGAWETFEYLTSRVGPADEVTMTAMINVAAQEGRVEKAKSLFDDMSALGLPRTITTYNALLRAQGGSAEHYDDALETFETMLMQGYAPNVSTCNLMIRAASKVGKVDHALRYVDVMRSSGLAPNAVTYTNVLATLGRAMDNDGLSDHRTRLALIDHAETWLQDMQQELGHTTNEAHNACLSVYTRSMMVNRAAQAFDRLFEDHAPDQVSYKLMMTLYTRTRRPDNVLALLQRMRDHGIAPARRIHAQAAFALTRADRIEEAMVVARELAASLPHGQALALADFRRLDSALQSKASGKEGTPEQAAAVQMRSELHALCDDGRTLPVRYAPGKFKKRFRKKRWRG